MSRNPVLTNRIYIEQTANLCYYCGNPAHYLFKNGKWCCSKYHQQCPKNRTTGKSAWNKGLNKEVDERVKQNALTMKHTKQNNNYIAWNKGLTKEIDERVKQNGISCSKSKKGVPNYKNRKPINKERGLSLNEFKFQLSGLLYTHWKFPILKRDGFKCTKCNSNKKLEVHHLTPHREIFNESVFKNNLNYDSYDLWTNDNFKEIIQTYLDLHIIDIGITLCIECHCKIDNYRKRFIKDNK